MKTKVIKKLESLFKEEQWGRLEPKDIGISKFKILDDLFNSIVSYEIIEEAKEMGMEHLAQNNESVIGMYLIGLLGYNTNEIEDALNLRKLIEIFSNNHKWAVVEMISDKILEYGESSIALRAKANSLERLGRAKEAIPVLENLLRIDRFDADVSKKLSIALLEQDQEKSMQYMKLSIEGFIKNNRFDEILPLWSKLVDHAWQDIPFFERIERMLVDKKQQNIVAALLKTLIAKYKETDNSEQSIELLKKILIYKPDENQSRRELIKLYEIKYSDHSQFEQFLKLSKLNNFKIPAKFAIQDFEKNIIFDKDSYAFHSSWKLGKIDELDNESIIISFKDKPKHRMSIKMALQSLTPIPKDHLYVIEYEDPDTINNLFENEFLQFFEILIKSYKGKILLADIKRELIPLYVDEKDWGKWWTKARTKIKKDSLFGISAKKKDLIFLREKPVTYVEELLENFTTNDSFAKKLDTTIEFINNIDKNEGSSVVQYFIDYFISETKGASDTRLILAYFILVDLAKFLDPGKVKIEPIKNKVINFIKESTELHLISMKISSYDYKKDFVNLIQEIREDWALVILGLLFETPVRIHRYIVNTFIQAKEFKTINTFIERTITGAKQFPEIFIWVAKNILSKTWDYDWLDYSKKDLTMEFFRLLNELKKIETDGNKLKNITLDLLFDNNEFVIKDLVKEFDLPFLSRIYDIFSNISFVAEEQVEKFNKIILEKFKDFNLNEISENEKEDFDTEKLIVTQEGYDKKKEEYEYLVKNELPQISKNLATISKKTADVRENLEYNSLMEKQQTLELAVSKIEEEIKKAGILNIADVAGDKVEIGVEVVFKNSENNEEKNYVILGPWDADFEKSILSYRSPIAKAMLGKKVGDIFEILIEDEIKKFEIISIKKFSK